jgi:uncharacterized membrane protein
MGGLFMLTRHVGMHVEQPDGPQEPLKVYESKSYYTGVLPGFLLTLATGLYALFQNPAVYLNVDGVWGATFHAKLMFVFILIVADQFFHMRMRRFHHKGEGTRKVFMAIHGTVGLCFIVIVFLIEGGFLK